MNIFLYRIATYLSNAYNNQKHHINVREAKTSRYSTRNVELFCIKEHANKSGIECDEKATQRRRRADYIINKRKHQFR
jgi:hypothetical protein